VVEHVDVASEGGVSDESQEDPEASITADQQYFDLYRLAIDMADRVSARRATANNYFAALHAVIASVVGIVPPILASNHGGMEWASSAIGAFAGILLAVAWWLTLRSYRMLNDAKFKVILAMEKNLPAAIYGDEWQYLRPEGAGWRDRYRTLSESEKTVPILFGALYTVILLWPAVVYVCARFASGGS
jgi:hypothetical protein